MNQLNWSTNESLERTQASVCIVSLCHWTVHLRSRKYKRVELDSTLSLPFPKRKCWCHWWPSDCTDQFVGFWCALLVRPKLLSIERAKGESMQTCIITVATQNPHFSCVCHWKLLECSIIILVCRLAALNRKGLSVEHNLMRRMLPWYWLCLSDLCTRTRGKHPFTRCVCILELHQPTSWGACIHSVGSLSYAEIECCASGDVELCY